jgi:hypothetical protein
VGAAPTEVTFQAYHWYKEGTGERVTVKSYEEPGVASSIDGSNDLTVGPSFSPPGTTSSSGHAGSACRTRMPTLSSSHRHSKSEGRRSWTGDVHSVTGSAVQSHLYRVRCAPRRTYWGHPDRGTAPPSLLSDPNEGLMDTGVAWSWASILVVMGTASAFALVGIK